MANKTKIGPTEVMLFGELTPKGTETAAKIIKARSYDERHAKALRFVKKAAAASEPIQMTVLEKAVGSSRGTTRRVLVRLAVDGLIALRGIDDPATPDLIRQFVLENRQSTEPEAPAEVQAAIEEAEVAKNE